MAMIIENAYVHLIENNKYVFARLTKIANCFVVSFIANNATDKPLKAPTHSVYVGNAFQSLFNGTIVVKDGTLIEGEDDVEENGWILPTDIIGNVQKRIDL